MSISNVSKLMLMLLAWGPHCEDLCCQGASFCLDTPLQYSCLENPVDGGAWKAAVDGVDEGRTRLSDFILQEIFPTQGSKPCLLHCRSEPPGKPLQTHCLSPSQSV